VKPIRLLILVAFAGLHTAGAESLWSPDFKGYLSGSKGLGKGDTLSVAIDASSSLSFSASNNDSKTLTLEFSGGEGGNLFSFLPQVKTGGSQSAKGGSSYSLRGEIPVIVTGMDASGMALISGSRSVTVEGKEESITLSGWVNPRDVDQKGSVGLSHVGSARLIYRTFLIPSTQVLSAKDIQEILAAGAAATSGAPAAATGPAATGSAPAAGAAALGAPTKTLALTDAKKKELLLLYLNRLMDVLFEK
jgi:flagellar L-ring protein precursor FlgH